MNNIAQKELKQIQGGKGPILPGIKRVSHYVAEQKNKKYHSSNNTKKATKKTEGLIAWASKQINGIKGFGV